MIKSDAMIMQTMYSEHEIVVAPERRAFLATKGKLLYSKYCDTSGKGICAESFAEYHLWRGEYVVVRDLLVFLQEQEVILQLEPDKAYQLEITRQLIQRIEHQLHDTIDSYEVRLVQEV